MNAVIDDQAGVGHELGDFRDAADVFHAILGREAEVGVQPVPDVVAVEDVDVHGEVEELALERVGDRGFARAG